MESIRYKWLVTGVSGFIGSNILMYLLRNNQIVVGLDNKGYSENLKDIKCRLTSDQWKNFHMIEGDILSFDVCMKACFNVDFVLHHAALTSVTESFNKKELYYTVNVEGFKNIVAASSLSGVRDLVYASSSAVYGECSGLFNTEENQLLPLSPYAEQKYHNELYARMVSDNCDVRITGLRYFNVFGPGQSAVSSYSAVIPKWIKAMLSNDEIVIYGDGQACRDFCFVDNVVLANIKACLNNRGGSGEVYNISSGSTCTINELFQIMVDVMKRIGRPYDQKALYQPKRYGEVVLSGADINKATSLLNYQPFCSLSDGLIKTVSWYSDFYRKISLV